MSNEIDETSPHTMPSPREGGLRPVSDDMIDPARAKEYTGPKPSADKTPKSPQPDQSTPSPTPSPTLETAQDDPFEASVSTASAVVTIIGWLGIPVGSLATIMGFYAVNVPIILIGITSVITSVGILRFSPTARYVLIFLNVLSILNFVVVILQQLSAPQESADQIPVAIIGLLINVCLIYFFNRPQVKRLFLYQ